MPQELRVVRCFQCLKFQVDIVKKANKWACKVCGAKQSLMKEFFRGSGKDCRDVVQEITARNIAADEQEAVIAERVLKNEILLPKRTPMEQLHRETTFPPSAAEDGNGTTSKWGLFVAKEHEEDSTDCLQLEHALARVSSTSFDRERINVHTRRYSGEMTGKWKNVRDQNGEALGEDKCIDSGKESATHPSSIRQPASMARNGPEIPTTSPWNKGPNSFKRNSITSRLQTDDASIQIDFHNKNPSLRVPQHDKFHIKPSSHGNCLAPKTSPTIDELTNAVCKKRKSSDQSAAPLMNFGKRHNDGNSTIKLPNCRSQVLESAPAHRSLERSKPNASETSSKWAQFVTQEEELDENGGDLFCFSE